MRDLSEREKQVSILVSQGKTNEDVGKSLGLAYKTIKFHLTNIYKALDINNRNQLFIKVMTEPWRFELNQKDLPKVDYSLPSIKTKPKPSEHAPQPAVVHEPELVQKGRIQVRSPNQQWKLPQGNSKLV